MLMAGFLRFAGLPCIRPNEGCKAIKRNNRGRPHSHALGILPSRDFSCIRILELPDGIPALQVGNMMLAILEASRVRTSLVHLWCPDGRSLMQVQIVQAPALQRRRAAGTLCIANAILTMHLLFKEPQRSHGGMIKHTWADLHPGPAGAVGLCMCMYVYIHIYIYVCTWWDI